MTDIPITNAERVLLIELVAAQINRFAGHREVRALLAEFGALLSKIEGANTQLIARKP